MTTQGDAQGSSSKPAQPGPDVPVYVISVAAELTGLHPQTLRAYDRMGLVKPGRTGGGGRRFSWHDIEMLRAVAELTANGIGLEGVRRILDLENRVTALSLRVVELEQELTVAQLAHERALRNSMSQNRNLPAIRPSAQAVTVWRRGRI